VQATDGRGFRRAVDEVVEAIDETTYAWIAAKLFERSRGQRGHARKLDCCSVVVDVDSQSARGREAGPIPSSIVHANVNLLVSATLGTQYTPTWTFPDVTPCPTMY